MTTSPLDLDLFELEEFLIEVLRREDTIIRFNGHMGVVEEATYFGDTPQYKYEKEVNQDYMKDRTNKVFVQWYNLIKLAKADILTQDIIDAWKKGEMTDWIPVSNEDCHECGARVFSYFNGQTFMLAEAIGMSKAVDVLDECLECRFAGGIKEYSVEIDVPSGRLVFANDFRCLIPEEIEDHYINYAVGIYDTVIDTAKQNFLTAFVGNTCPSVFATEDGVITIGNEGYNDEDRVVDPLEGKEVGSICTDLWWFYAMDGGVYDADTREHKPEVEVSINVKPGRYKMTVMERGDGRYIPGVSERFARIEFVS